MERECDMGKWVEIGLIVYRHGGMRVNLIKAQMVFNWLNAVDTGAK